MGSSGRPCLVLRGAADSVSESAEEIGLADLAALPCGCATCVPLPPDPVVPVSGRGPEQTF